LPGTICTQEPGQLSQYSDRAIGCTIEIQFSVGAGLFFSLLPHPDQLCGPPNLL